MSVASDTAGQALLIQVKNVPDLVKSQGGAAGTMAYSLAPGTITGKVYSTMQGELKTKLKEQGVDADVSIVSPAGYKPQAGGFPWKPVAIGSIAVSALTIGWLVLRGRR